MKICSVTAFVCVYVFLDAVSAQLPQIPCSNEMCNGLSNGNHEYFDPAQPNQITNPAYFLSCVHGIAYCRFCWPLTLQYSPACDKCLYKKTDRCFPTHGDGSGEGTWGQWSIYGNCNVDCGPGTKTRTRTCMKPTQDATCTGQSKDFMKCQKQFCEGTSGFTNVYSTVIKTLQKFFNTEYPDKQKTGKFQRALFQVQKASALMRNLGDPESFGNTLEERLAKLNEIFAMAVNSDHFSFARSTLGKALYVNIQILIKEERTPDEICNGGVEMLKELKNKSSPNFDLVFGSGGESTLMFTIDTTGSMSAEIYAARQMVSAIIDVVKEQPVDCIVAPFNDPTAGPVTKRASSQLKQCVNDIAALRAHGGDDCPEHSYGGMIEALKSQPKFGSSMFVFTDASAKDATLENSLTLKSLAESQSITINFLLTDGQSCLEGDTKYKEIADLTGGHVFSLKEKELPNLVAYVKSSLFIDTSIAVKGKSESTKETFQVDSNIFILIITVTVTNNADSVTLLTPNNSPYTQNITTISNIKVFEVVNPVPGEWSITYEDAVGNLTFGVEAISKEPIEFSFNMQAEVKGTTYAVFNPIEGQENDLIIRVAGGNIIQIPTLRVDVVMESGDVIISDLKLERTDTDFVFKTKFVPPPFPLKLLLKGQKKDGTRFQRVSRELISVQRSFFQVAKAGNELTARLGDQDVDIKIQVLNTGTPTNYDFAIRTSLGRISPQRISKTIDGIDFLDFKFQVPTSRSAVGKLATISITTGSPQRPIEFIFDLFIVE